VEQECSGGVVVPRVEECGVCPICLASEWCVSQLYKMRVRGGRGDTRVGDRKLRRVVYK
jgi:hypothetical protein